MTPIQSVARYYNLGEDATSAGGQAALTRRCYVPSVGYARASTFLVLFDDVDLPLAHITPSGNAVETNCPVIYPRYLFIAPDFYGFGDTEYSLLFAAAVSQYAPLKALGVRVLFYRSGAVFTDGLASLTTSYSGGDLYVAQVWSSRYPTSYGLDPSYRPDPPYGGGVAGPLQTWQTGGSFPTPEPPDPSDPTGGTILEGPTKEEWEFGPFFPPPFDATEHYKQTHWCVQNDTVIASRLSAVNSHGPNFRRFKVCDYFGTGPLTYAGYEENGTANGLDAVGRDLGTPRSTLFTAANTGLYLTSSGTSEFADNPSAVITQIFADAVAFFT